MKRVLVLVASMFCLSSYAQTSSTEIEMVLVKGGTFTMGCTAEQGSDCFDWEKPAHKVTLSDFYIGKYEVTQAQWIAVMGSNPSRFSDCENCPVEWVSWEDVQDFIQKLNTKTGLNYRLPTEAEWEYAARGGAQSWGYKYSGSNNVDEVAWFSDNSGKKTHPVGTKKANELGIYDMSGNVWEWCYDWYGYYSSEAKTNPKGASSASLRVLRGGSWANGRACFLLLLRIARQPVHRHRLPACPQCRIKQGATGL
jgi:formylglycine-generating enzyme required for sulfatase activity